MEANQLSTGGERLCMATTRKGEEDIISGRGPGHRYFGSNSQIQTVRRCFWSGIFKLYDLQHLCSFISEFSHLIAQGQTLSRHFIFYFTLRKKWNECLVYSSILKTTRKVSLTKLPNAVWAAITDSYIHNEGLRQYNNYLCFPEYILHIHFQ